jgi:hypothetical protein
MTLTPNHAALLSTVALLAVTAYFLLGSVPLLVLKHDNPMDARFIRSFYITYYRLAWVTATATAVSYALAGRLGMALGAAGIVLLTLLLRAKFIPQMDRLAGQIRGNDLLAIPAFRQIHKAAILINVAQLLAILVSLSLI